MKEDASAIFKEGKFKEAIEKFKECLEIDTLNANFNSTLLLNMAIAHDKLGDKEESLRCLNKCLKYNPKYPKALVKRGDMHVALEEFTEAIKDFSEASEHDPNGFNV